MMPQLTAEMQLLIAPTYPLSIFRRRFIQISQSQFPRLADPSTGDYDTAERLWIPDDVLESVEVGVDGFENGNTDRVVPG